MQCLVTSDVMKQSETAGENSRTVLHNVNSWWQFKVVQITKNQLIWLG